MQGILPRLRTNLMKQMLMYRLMKKYRITPRSLKNSIIGTLETICYTGGSRLVSKILPRIL